MNAVMIRMFLSCLVTSGFAVIARADVKLRPPLSLATFVADVTPPVGHPLQAGVGVKPVAVVADPLFAHGFVLFGAGETIVLCSVDWCGIGNDAHDRWREALAEAAGTTRERVLVCAIHQHDAPLVDLEAERLIAAQKPGRVSLDFKFHEEAVRSVAEAVKGSLKEARPVTHIGTGQAQVERVASTRRILGADGKVEFVRGSGSKEPRARTDPEGFIDPWLKTLSFWNGDKALASISVYATHPMSHYGQGQVSADFVGLARRRRQADDPGVLHFYANGCGGDLAPGKYNDGSPAIRLELAERLYRAWKSAWDQTKKHPLDKLSFRSIPFRLEPKETAGFRVDDLTAILTGATSSFDERVRTAYALSWRKRAVAKRLLDLPVLDFGVAYLLLLPGEPFVEYQLFAQRQRPDSFVMTLGYGDYGPVYIPTDKAFDEGGYEPGQWSFVAPGVEKTLKDAIAKALSEDKQISLATDGKTPYVIVTPAQPTLEEKTAVDWLAETLEQVTGANDDNSKFRFAWTAEALYVAIEQPLDKTAAIYEVSLMTPDRKGVQVALHAQPSGSVAAYFYAYPPTGMIAVPNRKSLSKFVVHKTEQFITAEFRIPWTDLPTEAKPNDELLLNIGTFPKPDSAVSSHVSSPWLIGSAPTYNPAYHATIRLGGR